MFLQEVSERLQEHVRRFDLDKRAVEACKEYLQSSFLESPDETQFYLRGLPLDDVAFAFVKHDFVFGSYRSWPHILSRVVFGRPNTTFVLDVEPFGYYALETIETGEVNNDWFRWEQMRDEEGKLTEFRSV